MTIKVGINGFGRTGRTFFRNACDSAQSQGNQLEIVYINDAYLRVDQMAYLFKYDSVHGKFSGKVDHKEGCLLVNERQIHVSNEVDPSNIKWRDFNVDFVIEATGYFTTKSGAEAHLRAGAKRVIITAPSKDCPMFVCGVNLDKFKPEEKIISNASETTHCASLLLSLLHNKYKIVEGSVSAIHAATSQQRTVDTISSHEDWRAGRSIANNIIPAPTGASAALGHVLPELQGKVNAGAYRVPTVDVSVLDLVVKLEEAPKGGYDGVLQLFRDAAKENPKSSQQKDLCGLIQVTDEPGVSTDFIGRTESAIVDAQAGCMIGNRLLKLVAWYDNEWGYSRRLVELILFVANKEKERK